MHVNKKLDAKSTPHGEENVPDNLSEGINSKSRKTIKPKDNKKTDRNPFFNRIRDMFRNNFSYQHLPIPVNV